MKLFRAWHGYKFIDPAESGALLPIIHLNGFKISNRTIYGCMDDLELVTMFTYVSNPFKFYVQASSRMHSGYGYKVRIVSDLRNIDCDLAASLDWALSEIHAIQHAARSGKPISKPRWPLIILRTPKGMSGPKQLHGEYIEGSFHSHGVPLPEANHDDEQFGVLKGWLESYRPKELFDNEGKPRKEMMAIVPAEEAKRMGQRKECYAAYVPLDVPAWKNYAVKKGTQDSCMTRIGEYLHDVIEQYVRSPPLSFFHSLTHSPQKPKDFPYLEP
jgi:xylulose-5-phosphate/fructose-6-phosphate phosphoketolase